MLKIFWSWNFVGIIFDLVHNLSVVMNQNKSERVIRRLQKLYTSPRYAGVGGYTFQSKLKIEKNWSVPLRIIYRALRGIPDYVAGLKNTKVKLYRHYILNTRWTIQISQFYNPLQRNPHWLHRSSKYFMNTCKLSVNCL